jgi:Sec-independent protein translocase protein TatA
MKPCIECGKDCDILPVQFGDFFTLTYLRVCSPECMFLVAYEFMRDIGEHKQFRNKLWELQNEEDKALRTNHVDEVTQESLRSMREHFEKCPDLLSRRVPNLVSDLFKSAPTISSNCGQTMRFTRPKLDDRIKWQLESVQRIKTQLADERDQLEKLLKEKSECLASATEP